MYARFLKFNTDPSKRSEVEAIADKAFAIAKQQQGYCQTKSNSSQKTASHLNFTQHKAHAIR